MASEKQITANRKNAKTAGVRSAKGKEIVKWNAVQHGILSHESVLDRGDMKESQALHDELRTKFFTELQPVGIIEVTLVDQLFTAYWRLRRVVSAERAMIEHKLIGHTFKRIIERGEQTMHNKQMAQLYFKERCRTSAGCMQLREEAKTFREGIEESGLPLPDYLVEKLKEQFGLTDGFPKSQTIFMYHAMMQDAEGLGIQEQGKKNLIAVAVETAKEMEEFFKIGEEVWKEMEDDGDSISAETKVLLGDGDLQRIQRYEAHLHRLYMHALHELQRTQSTRLGSPSPLAAALDVTVDNENGFVS